MKAGVYIVKDLFSEHKYILSLNGKEPFIRITNSISLSSFANGLIERDHKIVEQILEDPTKFEFTLLSKEIESNKVEEKNIESNIQYTDEQYNEFIDIKNIQPDGNLNKIAVTADIQGKLHISWEEAEKLFDIINIRYLEDDKWKKIEIKSSINEANSVIQ
jgi:hypothetical protein